MTFEKFIFVLCEVLIAAVYINVKECDNLDAALPQLSLKLTELVKLSVQM